MIAELRRVSNDPLYDTSAEREEEAEIAELLAMRKKAAKVDSDRDENSKPKKIVRRKRKARKDSEQ